MGFKEDKQMIENKVREARREGLIPGRVNDVYWPIALVLYCLAFFNGGLSEYLDELAALFPQPFGKNNVVALAGGTISI